MIMRDAKYQTINDTAIFSLPSKDLLLTKRQRGPFVKMNVYWPNTNQDNNKIYVLIVRGELNRFIGELWIEMFQISIALHLWNIRRNNLFGFQRLPIDCPKEWMTLNILKAGLRMTAQSFGRIFVEE